MLRYSLMFAGLIGLVLGGVPNKDRVMDQQLSDAEPGSPEYDHDAFVGRDEAKEFEKLPKEESKRRLGIIFDRIDKDDDGFVTKEELQDWIAKTQEEYVVGNTKKELEHHDKDKNGLFSWDEYYELNFGMLSDADWEIEDSKYSYKTMLKRDKKRWEAADLDKDNNLDMIEYQAYLHPEEFPRMKDIVLDETISDMDKDGDGKVDMNEYMNDLYRPENKDEVEPEWVATEREHFIKYRDLNDDGALDREEVRQWVLPEDYNHAHAEAEHLMFESDKKEKENGETDGKLTKEEMLDNYDVFVGSQATEWGDMLGRHDEF